MGYSAAMDPSDWKWDERGLIPAVVQDVADGAVLMVAWMNREALEATRATGIAHFYSRSRQKLWKKGETSGNTLAVRELRLDCDADTVLIRAEPAGPTCHTGERSCFFRHIDGDASGEPASAAILDHLERVLIERHESGTVEKSYTKSLFEGGAPKILAKIAEEHEELAEVLAEGDAAKVVHETADLLFHVMVGLAARDIAMADVWSEFEKRFGTSGHVEKASRG